MKAADFFFNTELSESAKNWINECDRLQKQFLGEHKRDKEFLKLIESFLEAENFIAFESAKSDILKIPLIFDHAWDFMKIL